ncbi:MAG TPA: four helix bundle protein [Bacteroidota bacterium]|jgi:four helix bundle protein|nr:four helix bundle protein [Bacteroidota bacterium]
MQYDIQKRTFDFGLQVVKFSNQMPETQSGRTLCRQLLRSGTFIGANVEEAEAAFTKDDFAYKMNIALKEARETHYWLRLIKESNLVHFEKYEPMIGECEELKKILGAIVSKVRRKAK